MQAQICTTVVLFYYFHLMLLQGLKYILPPWHEVAGDRLAYALAPTLAEGPDDPHLRGRSDSRTGQDRRAWTAPIPSSPGHRLPRRCPGGCRRNRPNVIAARKPQIPG
jgi:hypothetical protein